MEENDYKVIISKLDDTKLVKEMAIVDEEEKLIYIKKKALKEECQKRLRGNL